MILPVILVVFFPYSCPFLPSICFFVISILACYSPFSLLLFILCCFLFHIFRRIPLLSFLLLHTPLPLLHPPCLPSLLYLTPLLTPTAFLSLFLFLFDSTSSSRSPSSSQHCRFALLRTSFCSFSSIFPSLFFVFFPALFFFLSTCYSVSHQWHDAGHFLPLFLWFFCFLVVPSLFLSFFQCMMLGPALPSPVLAFPLFFVLLQIFAFLFLFLPSFLFLLVQGLFFRPFSFFVFLFPSLSFFLESFSFSGMIRGASSSTHPFSHSFCCFRPFFALSLSGMMLGPASGDGTVSFWDFAKAACTVTFTDHSQAVLSCAFHDCGDFLASGSMDQTARLLDINR